MATSPLFGWEEPDDVDLVKDGAAAIRTLGNAIDTSMGDLLGGITGQVLSKNSNTNMDFAWVTSDDANAIQNAIVDAKGDLISATAADTPARLAVGSDYGFLSALASESTGLKWNDGAWTTYTPTVSAVSGSYTTVSATGRYTRIGKLCAVQARVSITTNGTAAVATIITAPFTSASSSQTYNGSGRENLSTGAMLNCRIGTSDTLIYIEQYNALYAGGNNRQLDVSIIFEVA